MPNAVITDFEKAADLVKNKLVGWSDDIVSMVPNFLVAVLVILFFYFIARLARKGISKIESKLNRNDTLIRLAGTFVFAIIFIIGIFVALSVLQLNQAVTSLLAGAGIAGLAIGLAFQETTANFLASVIMAFRKPIQIGDLVETRDQMGYVTEVNLRATFLTGLNGETIIIPNKEVLYNVIINLSRTGMRRVVLEGGISYGDDLKKVQEVSIKALSEVPKRDKTKDIKFWFTGFGDSSINYMALLWLEDTNHASYLEGRSEMVMRLKAAFDANDILIPFPIRTLDFGIKGGQKLNDTVLKIQNNAEKTPASTNSENE